MNNKILDSSIYYLNFDSDLTTFLLSNNIKTISDLWILKRKDLKKILLSDMQINKIIIKLQLIGIDLNKKVYEKIK